MSFYKVAELMSEVLKELRYDVKGKVQTDRREKADFSREGLDF